MTSDDNRRIARNTMFLYIRTFVTMLIGLYTSRKILEALGVVDFGIYNVVGGVIMVLTFLNGSISAAIQRYLTYELGRKDYEAYNRVFNTALVIQSALGVLFLILTETVGLWFVNTHLVIPPERMIAANWVYQVSILASIISLFSAPFYASVIAHERMHVYAYVSMADAFVKLIFVILLPLMLWDRLITWSLMTAVITLIAAASMAVYCRLKFPHCHISMRHDRTLVRSMASFSGWNLFGIVAWVLKDQGSNIVLNIFGGPAINAARGISMQVRGAIINLTSGFQNAVNPQLVKSYAADEVQATHRLLCKSSRISYYLMLLPAIPVCFECSFLLDIWLVRVPAYAVLFTILVIVETLCEVFAGPMINTLMATGRIKWYQIVIGSTLLLNVFVSYILLRIGLPIYMPFAISIAVVIICNIGRLYFCKIQTGLSMRYYSRVVVLRCAIVTVAALVVPTAVYFAMPQGVVRFTTMTCLSVASTATIIWSIGLERGERVFIRQAVGNRLRRLCRRKPSDTAE